MYLIPAQPFNTPHSIADRDLLLFGSLGSLAGCVASEPGSLADPDLETTARSRASARLRILVVDDDLDFSEALVDVLQFSGHEVELAHDGEQAVLMFSTNHFDACVTDLKLPGISGLEVLSQIRSQKPQARVLVMSGFDTDPRLDEASTRGALAILRKPFSPDELLAILRRA